MEPITSGYNRDATQARDRTFPGAATTTGAEGFTHIVSASIVSTGGVDLG